MAWNISKWQNFRVCVNNKLSHWFPIKPSVVQGSPASPNLFNVLLSDLPKIPAKSVIYNDDITLYCTANSITEAKTIMQYSINKISLWRIHWGRKINPLKCAMTFFTHKKRTRLRTRSSNQPCNHPIWKDNTNPRASLQLAKSDMGDTHRISRRKVSKTVQIDGKPGGSGKEFLGNIFELTSWRISKAYSTMASPFTPQLLQQTSRN